MIYLNCNADTLFKEIRESQSRQFYIPINIQLIDILNELDGTTKYESIFEMLSKVVNCFDVAGIGSALIYPLNESADIYSTHSHFAINDGITGFSIVPVPDSLNEYELIVML